MNPQRKAVRGESQWPDLDRWFKFGAIACFVAYAVGFAATSSFAERYLTSLPHAESFDTNGYISELVWITRDCTHTWLPNGGWRGGATKFTPPTTGEGYCGIGQFYLRNAANVGEQLNVRFLIYHGSTWAEYEHNNKLMIFNRDGNSGRPMIITRRWIQDNVPWETWGPCDGTVCRYEGGNFWPDGTDSLRIGNSPLGREEQWISVELEANTRTGMIRLYVTTQDGELEGQYVQRDMSSSGPGGTWAYIDILGGYMKASEQSHPGNYYMIDELVIGSQYIGPPAGFVSESRPSPPNSIQVQ